MSCKESFHVLLCWKTNQQLLELFRRVLQWCLALPDCPSARECVCNDWVRIFWVNLSFKHMNLGKKKPHTHHSAKLKLCHAGITLISSLMAWCGTSGIEMSFVSGTLISKRWPSERTQTSRRSLLAPVVSFRFIIRLPDCFHRWQTASYLAFTLIWAIFAAVFFCSSRRLSL